METPRDQCIERQTVLSIGDALLSAQTGGVVQRSVDRVFAGQTSIAVAAMIIVMALGVLASCGPTDDLPPPPTVVVQGLPVSGTLGDAIKAGFNTCVNITKTEIRCRRSGVMFDGFGPFSAAVNLNGRKGASGFDQLTLWHDQDQNALLAVANALERRGWRTCFTGEGQRGDQGIYTRPGEPVRVSLDLSYSGKRRLRVIPQWNKREPSC